MVVGLLCKVNTTRTRFATYNQCMESYVNGYMKTLRGVKVTTGFH